jgi:hypothetical protein
MDKKLVAVIKECSERMIVNNGIPRLVGEDYTCCCISKIGVTLVRGDLEYWAAEDSCTPVYEGESVTINFPMQFEGFLKNGL